MTPTVFRKDGYRFFFFSREETRVHVVSGDGEEKFWLEPEIELAKNHGFNRIQLKQIETLIEENQDELISAWRKHFGG